VTSGPLSPLGWGLAMTNGQGRQLGGALDGQLASWKSLHSNKIQVETTLNGTQVVKGEGEVSTDGKKISVRFGGRGVVYEWMSEEEEKAMKSSLESDIAPSSPYPMRSPGKIVFLSGLPGSGKSSTGRALAALFNEFNIFAIRTKF